MAKAAKKWTPPTLKERILGAIKQSEGTMPITVVVGPEDEDECRRLFKRLGKKAGVVTWRMEPELDKIKRGGAMR